MGKVVFDSVTRIYPGSDHPAVDKLNLEIADGEFLVLVGLRAAVKLLRCGC